MIIVHFSNNFLITTLVPWRNNITKSIVLVVGLSGSSRSGIQTPLGHQGLGHLLGLAELEDTHLPWHNGALVLGSQLGDQLGDEPAGLLGVQVTDFLRNVNQ